MKILVIQQKMIGDVLTSSILFDALRQQYPQAELHYLVEPHTMAVLENNPHIDRLVLLDPKQDKGPLGLWRLSRKLRKEGYTTVIDVYSKISTGMMSFLSGAEKRISYHKWYTSLLYTQTIERKKDPETIAGLAIEHRLSLLKPLKADFPEVLKPKIYLNPQETDSAQRVLEKLGIDLQQPLLMVNILGSSPAKTYPLEYMAKILDYIVENFDPQILFNYIPTQENEARKVYQYCTHQTREKIFLDCYGNSLREFLAIAFYCDALIGNEGGAINMAKALEVPTFAFFSPQVDKKTWSIFEDGKKNVSVHLSEIEVETFTNKSPKELTRNCQSYYQRFKPQYIFPKLLEFLKENL